MYKEISKKAISALLIVTFMLSLTSVIGMAAPDYYTAADATPWLGTNVPKAKMVSSAGISVNAEGNTSSANTGKAVMEYNETGVYGKVTSDASYYTYDYKERNEAGNVLNSFNNFFFSYSPTMVDGVHEFSFAYEAAGDDGKIIQSLYRLGTNSSTGKGYEEKEVFLIETNGITVANTKKTFKFEPHKWYTITLVYDMAGKNYKAYVNGALEVEGTMAKIYYGLGQAQIGPAYKAKVYWDNINKYDIADANSFTVGDATKANLQSSVQGIAVNGDVITASDNATVSDIKNAVSASLRTNDTISDTIRFYNSDYSALLNDGDLVKGANIVVASTRDYSDSLKNVESTYTYYSVDRYVYEFAGINDGSVVPGLSGKNNPDLCEVVVESDGIGGKELSADKYIKYEVGSGNKYANFLTAGAVKAYEFSLYMPSGSEAYLALAIGFSSDENGDDGKNYASYTFKFGPDGVEENNLKIADMPFDQWVNFAVVPPAGGEDNTYEFYMNGVQLVQKVLINNIKSNGNIRHARFTGTTVSGEATLVYLDNIRSSTDVAYVPEYDMEAAAAMTNNGISTRDKTISVISSSAKVSDVVKDLSVPAYTNVKVYNASGELADSEAVVADGYKVVVAATNGTEMERAYSYYTIRVVAGKVVFDKPYIELNSNTGAITGNVNVYNYSGNAEKYQVYLAVYSGDELTSLIPVPLDATAGQSTSVAPASNLAAGENAKLFVWDEDGITPELECFEIKRR